MTAEMTADIVIIVALIVFAVVAFALIKSLVRVILLSLIASAVALFISVRMGWVEMELLTTLVDFVRGVVEGGSEKVGELLNFVKK